MARESKHPVVEWGGQKWYFSKWGYYKNRGNRSLHREIYREAHGEIPAGYHIHHKDYNPSNNALENLECLTPKEHMARHPPRGFLVYDAKTRGEFISVGWKNKEPMQFFCAQCKEPFYSKRHGTVWCSGRCQQQFFRDTGRFSEERKCQGCGGTYSGSLYKKTKFCSRACGYAAGRTKEIPCVICGKPFRPRNKTIRACGHTCGTRYKQMRARGEIT